MGDTRAWEDGPVGPGPLLQWPPPRNPPQYPALPPGIYNILPPCIYTIYTVYIHHTALLHIHNIHYTAYIEFSQNPFSCNGHPH